MDKTKSLIRDRVWFPGIDDAVERFIRRCEACSLTAASSKLTPIQSTKIATRPWQRIAIGFHGPIADGNELMVLIDEHSKFPVVAEVKLTAMFHVKSKLDEIFSLTDYPRNIRSDNGPSSMGQWFEELQKGGLVSWNETSTQIGLAKGTVRLRNP